MVFEYSLEIFAKRQETTNKLVVHRSKNLQSNNNCRATDETVLVVAKTAENWGKFCVRLTHAGR